MGPGDKLDKILQGFSENSINKMKIQYAMFNAAALEAYNKNMQIVNDDIDSKISLYGMKKDECLDFINNITAKICKSLGANSLVAGSYIYGSDCYKKAIDSLI